MSLRRLAYIVAAVAMIGVTCASAQPAPQPDSGRTAQYCNQLFAEAGYQRNQQADAAAQVAAQLDMAHKDLGDRDAEIAALKAQLVQIGDQLGKATAAMKAAGIKPPKPEPPKK